LSPKVSIDASGILDNKNGKVFDTGQCKKTVYCLYNRNISHEQLNVTKDLVERSKKRKGNFKCQSKDVIKNWTPTQTGHQLLIY